LQTAFWYCANMCDLLLCCCSVLYTVTFKMSLLTEMISIVIDITFYARYTLLVS